MTSVGICLLTLTNDRSRHHLIDSDHQRYAKVHSAHQFIPIQVYRVLRDAIDRLYLITISVHKYNKVQSSVYERYLLELTNI